MVPSCKQCESLRAELAQAEARIAELQAERHELSKLVELQQADLERYRKAYERVRPNCPERVPTEQLQLAFERVLETVAQQPAANDTAQGDDETPTGERPLPPKRKPRRDPHGRRDLDVSRLPIEEVVIDPDEVLATGGEGFELIGVEISSRIASRPASYIRLVLKRRKWAAKVPASQATEEPAPETTVVVAPLPESVWPKYMADPSVIAQVIVSKYDDVLPLHRQERISERQGFRLPRSTQCGFLGPAHDACYRIVDAMFDESRDKSFCIATDATGGPVKSKGGCDKWHVFVFIADRDHVVFRYSPEHTSAAVVNMLDGYKGYLLADASLIYDTLYRDHGMTEVACWQHQRRYFWKALETDRTRATEAISIIGKLFEVDRETRCIPMPDRTETRKALATPVRQLLEQWIDLQRESVDPRSPLDAAITYYDNQKVALWRFLDDGRLRLDNAPSEQQLRNVALGRHNWLYFANERGLRWYVAFRSLIASCRLHGINAQQYLEQMLRLAPHWSTHRMLELSPKYWNQTLAALDDRYRKILTPPWEVQSKTVPYAPRQGARAPGKSVAA